MLIEHRKRRSFEMLGTCQAFEGLWEEEGGAGGHGQEEAGREKRVPQRILCLLQACERALTVRRASKRHIWRMSARLPRRLLKSSLVSVSKVPSDSALTLAARVDCDISD